MIDFPVTEYSGTKSILISTRTVMGGKNPFMGIAYVVVGGICIVLGALFTVAHLVKPRYVRRSFGSFFDPFCVSLVSCLFFARKLGDHTYLTWNNEQRSTAVATGRDDRFGSHGL
jgi:Cell cycle control protein